MEKTQFKQTLKPDDLIAYNCYVATKRSKSSIMTKVLGIFLIILGIVDLFKENPQYLTCIFVIAMGVFGALILNPLMLRSQKKLIRKRISADYPDVPMDVTICEEGIIFEIPLEEEEKEEPKHYDDGEIHTVTPIVDVPSNNELREEEYHSEETEEVVDLEESNIETEEVKEEEKKPQNNVLTIPWVGIKTIEDDGTYMYVNMAGYQSMIIKKEECETIDEVVEFCKTKLTKPTHYIETVKKENDHE